MPSTSNDIASEEHQSLRLMISPWLTFTEREADCVLILSLPPVDAQERPAWCALRRRAAGARPPHRLPHWYRPGLGCSPPPVSSALRVDLDAHRVARQPIAHEDVAHAVPVIWDPVHREFRNYASCGWTRTRHSVLLPQEIDDPLFRNRCPPTGSCVAYLPSTRSGRIRRRRRAPISSPA